LLRLWRSIPDKDLESALAQSAGDSRTDDPESDQADILSFRACHNWECAGVTASNASWN
jgi:hypothetical protein